MSKFSDIAPRIWNGLATDAEMSALAIADLVAIKSDEEHVRYRPCTRAAPRVDADLGQVEYVANAQSADRVGDVIVVAGWDTSAFMRNPILQRYHDSQRLPLGTVQRTRKGKTDDETPALIALAQYFDEEDQDDEGKLLRRYALRKVMPAVSVGFLPRKTTRPDDPKERAKLGLGEWGVLVDKAELLEISLVNVGCHPDALAKQLQDDVAAGLIPKSIAADVARDFAPSTRTVVTVPGLTLEDTLTPRLDALTKALGDLSTRVDSIHSTLGAELPALKGLLSDATRGSGAPSADLVSPQVPEVQPAPDSKSAHTEALTAEEVLSHAFDAIDRAVAARRAKGAQ